MGFSSAIGLITLMTFALDMYGLVSFSKGHRPEGILPDNIKTLVDWRKFTGAFFIGGSGGVIFATFLLTEVSRSGL